MAKERIKDLLERGAADTEVTVEGWLRTVRHSKNVSFLDISDGSCMAGIQAVAAPELDNYEIRGRQAHHRLLRARGRPAGGVAGQGAELRDPGRSRVEVVGLR